jgi:Immunity protein 26
MKIETGLVFAIPLAENGFGFGQLIAWQNPIFYAAGYDLKAESPNVSDGAIQRARPVLLGNFFDVLIRNGRWLPIKTLATPDVPYPCFKIKIGDKFYVESWDRKKKREATSDECDMLPFRTNCGPIILENALKAYFELETWNAKLFDNLRLESVVTLSRLL